MRYITAAGIHDGKGWLPENSTIGVAEDGTISTVVKGTHPDAVFYEGILVPGFVNAHCHLELSHMKGVVPQHTTLIPFLQTIPTHRNDFTDKQKKEARLKAYNELLNNGIVAVGDIANTTDTLDVRADDKLHMSTFVESIGFVPANAAKMFGFAEQSFNAFEAQPRGSKMLREYIVPHAPYSVSSVLFSLIDAHRPGGIISIHNQESPEEDKYYLTKEGRVRELLHALGIEDSSFMPAGKSSLRTYLDWLSPSHPFLLVHNTCTDRADVQYAMMRVPKLYWCLCPNANLYIEDHLPDIPMLMEEGAVLCIGTDSLASNHQLDILAELHTIKKKYTHISWEQLFTWATYNGALALGFNDILGTIEEGKNPGIVQITGHEDARSYKINRVI